MALHFFYVAVDTENVEDAQNVIDDIRNDVERPFDYRIYTGPLDRVVEMLREDVDA